MKHVIKAAAMAIGLAISSSPFAALEVASVNGQAITLADVQAKLSKSPLLFQMNEEKATQIISELITSELLAQQALDAGLDKQEDVLQRINQAIRPSIISAMQQKIRIEKQTNEYVEQYYTDHINKFRSVKVSQIQVDHEEKINDILAQLKEGADFAELAKKHSLHALSRGQGGDIGYIFPGNTPKPFEDAAFSLAVDQISEPVRTELGYHIIKVTDVREPKKFGYLTDGEVVALKNKVYSDEIQKLKAATKVEMHLERLEKAAPGVELARVGDIIITTEDYVSATGKITADNKAYYDTPAGRVALLGELVADELLFREGLRQNLDRLPSVEPFVAREKRNALADAMLEKIRTHELGKAEIKRYYEEHPHYFGGIKLSHIVVDDESKAKDIHRQLKEGADFAQFAEEHSTDNATDYRGGDLGSITIGGNLVRSFQDKAFSLQIGEISEPVKTPLGYHIIKVVDMHEVSKFEELAPPEIDVIRRKMFEDILKYRAENSNAVIDVKEGVAKDIVARFRRGKAQ